MSRRKASGAERTWKDEESVFAEGCAVLEKRLGPDGLLRFLRVVSKGHDRYEDIRRPLTQLDLAQIKKNMAQSGLLKRKKP